nr:hypothetical protein [uncultured Flavobacterium sp.]
MEIAFTICSNNYLAMAKTLGDSFLKYHPNWKFIIGLVDEYDNSFDYSSLANFEIIKVSEINVRDFDCLIEKYNIIELNTAVKPSYLNYIFTNYNAQKLIYLDPDILVVSYLKELIEALDTVDIVITPHICTPIDDDFAPTDYHTLRGGVYNLGFIAFARYEKVKNFIDWWNERVLKYGYCDFSRNLFYDQMWINYLPSIFDNYLLIKHYGYNMANWNLHERVITNSLNENYIINDLIPLRFFHFSGYKYNNPNKIASYLTRYSFETRPDLLDLFTNYHKLLVSNQIEKTSKLNVAYKILNENAKLKKNKKPISKRILHRIKVTIKVFFTGNK